MAFEEWKKRSREKELERINRELEELREKGTTFEKKSGRSMSGKNSPSSSSTNVILIVIIALLAIGWASTFFFYTMKVDSLNDDAKDLNQQITTKAEEVSKLESGVANLTTLVEARTKNEDELNDEVRDLEEEKEDLEAELKTIDLELTKTKLNITTQGELVSGYKDCITDDDGPINKSLSVCNPYV